MHRGHIDMLDEILVARRAALGADAAPVLGTVFGQRRTFDIAQVRNGDDHLVVGVEILRVELFGSVNDLRAPFVAVFGLHLQQFVLNDLHLQFAAAQHIVEISDLRLQLVALGNQLVVFESRQSA